MIREAARTDRLLFCHHLRGGGELFVELLAVGIGQGLAQELIDTDALASALFEGAGADVPAMKIKRSQSIGQPGSAYGVKPAGYGFDKRTFAQRIGPLDGTQAILPFEQRIGTFFSVPQQRSFIVSVRSDAEESVRFHLSPSVLAHKFPVFVIISPQKSTFLPQKRSPALSLYATSTPATFIVAAEIFKKYFRRDENIPYKYGELPHFKRVAHLSTLSISSHPKN